MIFIINRLPKEGTTLAIVDYKVVAIVSGIADKDDFLVHTPRKMNVQLSEVKQVL